MVVVGCPSLLAAASAASGISLLLGWLIRGGTMPKQPPADSVFILDHPWRMSPSTRQHCTGPSCQQLSGAQAQCREPWSALVCPRRNPIYLPSGLFRHTGSDLTWHLLLWAATDGVGVPRGRSCLGQGWGEGKAAKSNHKPSWWHPLRLRKSQRCKLLLQDKEMLSAQISLYVSS